MKCKVFYLTSKERKKGRDKEKKDKIILKKQNIKIRKYTGKDYLIFVSFFLE